MDPPFERLGTAEQGRSRAVTEMSSEKTSGRRTRTIRKGADATNPPANSLDSAQHVPTVAPSGDRATVPVSRIATSPSGYLARLRPGYSNLYSLLQVSARYQDDDASARRYAILDQRPDDPYRRFCARTPCRVRLAKVPFQHTRGHLSNRAAEQGRPEKGRARLPRRRRGECRFAGLHPQFRRSGKRPDQARRTGGDGSLPRYLSVLYTEVSQQGELGWLDEVPLQAASTARV